MIQEFLCRKITTIISIKSSNTISNTIANAIANTIGNNLANTAANTDDASSKTNFSLHNPIMLFLLCSLNISHAHLFFILIKMIMCVDSVEMLRKSSAKYNYGLILCSLII